MRTSNSPMCQCAGLFCAAPGHRSCLLVYLILSQNLTVSEPIAQFGRTGLVTETASVLIADFARDLEDRISLNAPAMESIGPQRLWVSVLAILHIAGARNNMIHSHPAD